MRGWRAGGKQENRPQNYLSFSTLTLLPFSPIYHQFTCAAPMAARLAISLAAAWGSEGVVPDCSQKKGGNVEGNVRFWRFIIMRTYML